MYDCHVHSSFSGDSNMDPKIAINTAMKLGFEGIYYPDYDDVFMIDFDKDRLKRDYSGKIKVLKGIEVGIQPHVIEESNDIVKKCNWLDSRC